MTTIITLSWQEMYLCATAASMRSLANMREGRGARYGFDNSLGRFDADIIGCIGEMAVAKYFNFYWGGWNRADLNGNDVGGKVQVRSRRRAHYELMLHREDKDNDPFVLALVHDLPNVILRGWIFAHAGKRPEYWSDPAGGRPAFFVPQSALWTMDELAQAIRSAVA